MDKKLPSTSDIMKSLTAQDFLSFGVDRIAYIRPAELNARTAWAISAADGRPLSLHLTEDAAVAASRQRDLKPVRVH